MNESNSLNPQMSSSTVPGPGGDCGECPAPYDCNCDNPAPCESGDNGNGKGQLYRSRYYTKVRIDMWYERNGCFRTMGPPPGTRFEFPDRYLRKHSRVPPVFFDRKVLNDPKLYVKPIHFDRPRSGPETDYPPCRSESCTRPPPDTKPRDFIWENAWKVVRMIPRRLTQPYTYTGKCFARVNLSDAPPNLQPDFGEVPEFIKMRAWEEEGMDPYSLQQQMLEASDCPPGCRPLSDWERSCCIQDLSQHWTNLTNQYQNLPAHAEDWVNERKDSLENEIQGVEADLNLLNSEGPVFIPQENAEDVGSYPSASGSTGLGTGLHSELQEDIQQQHTLTLSSRSGSIEMDPSKSTPVIGSTGSGSQPQSTGSVPTLSSTSRPFVPQNTDVPLPRESKSSQHEEEARSFNNSSPSLNSLGGGGVGQLRRSSDPPAEPPPSNSTFLSHNSNSASSGPIPSSSYNS